MSYTKEVPAAVRTLRLLETLAAAPRGLSAGDLAEKLDISRSSLFALLNTLKARGYAEHDGRLYRAGSALYTLTPGRQRNRQALIDAFHADAEINLLRETVALARLDGLETVLIAQKESNRPVRSVLNVGQRHPAASSAAGLVLLAGLPPDTIQRNFSGQILSLPERVEQIQQSGLAQTTGDERVEMACPICPNGHQPDTALLISIPAFRWPGQETIGKILRNAAARLSYRVGAPVYQPYQHLNPEQVEPTAPLDTAELNQFLKGAWGARLACVKKDGLPHVVPLWYEWDGKSFWVTASPSASWATTIRENSWVALTIDEPWPPLRRALISGEARPAGDNQISGGLLGLRQRLIARYLGQGAASPLTRQGGWEAFKITPKKIIGQRGLVR